MIFSNFTEGLKPYLKSVRVLKDYVSFDLYLSNFWSIPKKFVTIRSRDKPGMTSAVRKLFRVAKRMHKRAKRTQNP